MKPKNRPQRTSFYHINFLSGKMPLQKRLKVKPKPKGKQKPKPKPDVVNAMHEKWFFGMKPAYFKQICKDWNEQNLKLTIPKKDGYDEWLNYFKELSPTTIRMLAATGQDILSTEAYAALRRWHDIISNPHRIEKIHQSGLTTDNGKGDKVTITQHAANNDRLAVLMAIRDELAQQLQKGAGARDTAALAAQLTEIMTQIKDYEKRIGPNKDTRLGQLLHDAEELKKRPSKSGGGARKNSFKSRITIKDVEGKQ